MEKIIDFFQKAVKIQKMINGDFDMKNLKIDFNYLNDMLKIKCFKEAAKQVLVLNEALERIGEELEQLPENMKKLKLMSFFTNPDEFQLFYIYIKRILIVQIIKEKPKNWQSEIQKIFK